MPYKDPVKRKAKHREYSKRWYEGHKKLVLDRNRERKKGHRKAWIKYKSSKSCTKCGISHPAVLDFHHVIRENKKSVPMLLKHGRYAAAIREAETKCIPLCSNCHRMLHWGEHKRRQAWDRLIGKEKTY